MEISTKQLRTQPGKILADVLRGQEITITYRGRACAKMVPLHSPKTGPKAAPKTVDRKIQKEREAPDELFGMWKDREDLRDVEQFVRTRRSGRKLW